MRKIFIKCAQYRRTSLFCEQSLCKVGILRVENVWNYRLTKLGTLKVLQMGGRSGATTRVSLKRRRLLALSQINMGLPIVYFKRSGAKVQPLNTLTAQKYSNKTFFSSMQRIELRINEIKS